MYLRGATAYGFSPHLRADLVVNNLTGWAFLTGKVPIKSDGSPWRPFVHVEDIARGLMAMLTAPRERVCNEAFNVGRTGANYQIRHVAELVRQSLCGSHLEFATGGGPEQRCYRVDFTKIHRVIPEFQPQWTLEEGIEQLSRAFRDYRLELSDFEGPRFLRISAISTTGRTGGMRKAP